MKNPLESVIFTLSDLREGYGQGAFTIPDIIQEAWRRAENTAQPVFLHRPGLAEMLHEAERCQALLQSSPDPWREWPLLGMPFAVKDNIDVSGMPTTAACPALVYRPPDSAVCVDLLLRAGAICVGKTNMDQLATGLVGVRSPYGACHNAFDSRFISGGSSSGSGLAVALGLCAFSLGTDTAGSGRVPASLGNIVGLKPTRGRISTRGLIPACPSLDCISVFSLVAEDAATVLAITSRYDGENPWSRALPGSEASAPPWRWPGLRLGLPLAGQLDFAGNENYAVLFAAAKEYGKGLGAEEAPQDIEPLLEAARLLYQGPWLAERYAAIAEKIDPDSPELLPVIRRVLANGPKHSAIEVFQGMQKLQALRRSAEKLFAACDVLLLPTIPTVFTLEQIAERPVENNTILGRFTNFVNLLDLSAITVPAGFDAQGIPFGVTLLAPAFRDEGLLGLAQGWQEQRGYGVGAGLWALPMDARLDSGPPPVSNLGDTVSDGIPLLVFGLHLKGQPLAHELEDLGAAWQGEARTAKGYAMHLLERGEKKLPAVFRRHGAKGGLAGEIWRFPSRRLGDFLRGIKPPLGLGWIECEDGRQVLGFLAEPEACRECRDITAYGGWRSFLPSLLP